MSALREAFRHQARACAELGSPFMARLMDLAAERLAPGRPVADRVLGWQGDVSPGGQSVPLRLAGALHAMKRAGNPALSAVYPPAEVPDDALWAAVESAFVANAPALLHWLDSPPQTNEVRRGAALIPALHMLGARFGLPIGLSELGCSAGLNLRADRFRLEAVGVGFGDPDAPVRLRPDWRGPVPAQVAPEIASRDGVDLNPLDPDRDAERLFAYLWPDQPERLALTAAAIATARAHPARVDRGDAAGWLEAALAEPRPGVLHLVFHTVAWQYFPPATQARAAAALARAGARASEATPLARFAMEADGGRGAAVSLQVWPGGATIGLGRADFHGRWIEWSTPCLAP